MRKYKSYKFSGVDWIGDIPIHWSTYRLGMLGSFSSSGIDKKSNDNEVKVRMVNYTDLVQSRNHFPIQTGEKDYMVVTTPKSKLQEHKLRKGDMVFIPSSETEEDLGYSSLIDFDEDDIVYSYHILRFQFRIEVDHYFKKYFVNNHPVLNQFSSEGKGTTRQIIGRNVFNNVKVVLPPLSEQKQIVEYLDTKTSMIDSLIEKTQRKIELLKEKRTSIINEVVTKGLNPNVKMKDSGVEWIGEIPEHWNLIKMKQKGDVIIGLSYSPENIVDENEGVLVMRSSNVQNGKPSFLDNVYVNSFIPEKIKLKEGDILICSRNGSRNLIGKNCLITKNEEGLTFGVFMTVFRTPFYKFIFWLLNSPVFESQSGLFLTSTINQLTVSTLENMVLPFVEDEMEQEKISNYLIQETNLIDKSISVEQKRVEVLKEFRQSLISEVVTGKVKVISDE